MYLAKRLAGACVVLWAIITITFGLMHAIPGGPFTQEKKLPPAVMATVEARYHLDEPLWSQYVDYVRHAAVLDLGPSYKYPGKTVNDIIAETFPVSAQLGLISLFLAIGAGVLAGMAAAWYKNTWIDYTMMVGATLGVSVPSFILAAVLIQLFAFTWPILPAALWKGPAYVVLPALALAAQPTAFIMRLTRSSLLDALGQDYIRTVRSRGIGTRSLICHHALRNALLPIITLLGFELPGLFSGAIITEKVFNWPGAGHIHIDSLAARDYPVLMGFTLFLAVLTIVGNLLADVLYAWADPRIRVRS